MSSERLSIMRRSPYGERGLKYMDFITRVECVRRSPYGERGLKFHLNQLHLLMHVRRSPYGERGLK